MGQKSLFRFSVPFYGKIWTNILVNGIQGSKLKINSGMILLGLPWWLSGKKYPPANIGVVQSLSCIQLFATPWTAAHEASLSFSVSLSLLKFMFVHWVTDAIQPTHPLLPLFFSGPESFPESKSFPVSCLFASGGQSTEASASASVLLMNIQGWFH